MKIIKYFERDDINFPLKMINVLKKQNVLSRYFGPNKELNETCGVLRVIYLWVVMIN